MMKMASIRIWPILSLVLWTTVCVRSPRPDLFTMPAAQEGHAPISLVTPDGVELELLSVEAKALVVEPLAFTELHLRFRNPERRILEGRFRIVLPPSATVARFAMKVHDGWEEAELVDLAQARQAYELFLHRRQDPALLEHSAGNEFSARVFPIAPMEEKELILGYSEDLVQPDQPYRIAFKGLRDPTQAQVTLLNAGEHGIETRRLMVPTSQDFEQPLAGGERLLRHGELVVGRVTVPGTTADAPIRSLAVLFDTSASRALGLQRQVDLLRGLVAEAGRKGVDFDLRILAFDQETVDIYHGPAKGFGDAQARMLLDRGALGASNLEQALHALQRLTVQPAERILVIGDGVTTAGALDGATLAMLMAPLGQRGVKRLDAIVVGGVQDVARLAALTTSGLSENGTVLNGQRPADWLWSRLTRKAAGDLAAPTVHRAVWGWPQRLRGVLPGDSVMMLARLDSVGAWTSTPNIVDVDEAVRPLLERAVARAQIAEIEEQIDQTPVAAQEELKALKARLLDASTAARVLCRLTGFVVLENDSAWEQSPVSVPTTKVLRLDSRVCTPFPMHAPGLAAAFGRRWMASFKALTIPCRMSGKAAP